VAKREGVLSRIKSARLAIIGAIATATCGLAFFIQAAAPGHSAAASTGKSRSGVTSSVASSGSDHDGADSRDGGSSGSSGSSASAPSASAGTGDATSGAS
jgi:hypothetical protein